MAVLIIQAAYRPALNRLNPFLWASLAMSLPPHFPISAPHMLDHQWPNYDLSLAARTGILHFMLCSDNAITKPREVELPFAADSDVSGHNLGVTDERVGSLLQSELIHTSLPLMTLHHHPIQHNTVQHTDTSTKWTLEFVMALSRLA